MTLISICVLVGNVIDTGHYICNVYYMRPAISQYLPLQTSQGSSAIVAYIYIFATWVVNLLREIYST